MATCLVTAGCAGTIVDGFCDVCGMQPADAPVEAPDPGRGSQRTGSQRTGSTQLAGTSSRSSRRGSASTRSQVSRRLGLGLVTVPDVPRTDPLHSLMAEAKVPETKRFCTGTKADGTPCESALTKEKCTTCGHAHEYTGTPRKGCVKCGGPCEVVAREKGFCNVCGTPYDFRPKLAAGEVVAGQYETCGCLAFGGMGWIYLAKDVTLNRYVLLKGLINSSDPNLARAAIAERQFLAEVKHPNIVAVYTCVSDTRAVDGKAQTHAYTVMEFIAGTTLKALRKDRGPLPVTEVLAYMHPVLAALGHLHASGLLYNDLKPDNVMLEDGDIKVIDLGGVCRMTKADGDIYTTIGYAAPELAKDGPSITSDLYSVGRMIAVLVTEFQGYQSTYKYTLRGPLEEPLYRTHDSLYLLLQKACHDNPNMRFQTADEMAEQVVGVLREIVAHETATPRPADSRQFGPDTLALRTLDDPRGVDVLDVSSFPALKMRPDDPATAFMLANVGAGAPERQTPVYAQAIAKFPHSIEALLALGRNQLVLGNYEAAERHLEKVEAIDAFDWRVIWYRGLALIAQHQFAEALAAFETCYREIPGEQAPKLAIAIAAELAGDRSRATTYYDMVSRTDPGFATAGFGLARCLAAIGKRDEAVAALERIGQTSSLYGDAQKAIAAVLIRAQPSTPGVAELAKASSTIEALMLEGAERHKIVRDIFVVTLALLDQGHVKPAPTVTLLGHRLDEADVRRGLETAYRNLARLTDDRTHRIALVDLANQVRPKTWR
jgi:serine/threonine-protein kinase PknG